MDTYMNQIPGVGGVPLNYIVCWRDEPEENAEEENDAKEAVALAPLQGDAFAIDNRKVYEILKSLIIEGPVWSYFTTAVDKAKDGRAAWILLRDHFEGETYLNCDVEEAEAVIEALHYKKEFANFSFEDFITQLTKHYNTLERHDQAVTEEKKVQDLLRKITDPTLEAAKQAVRINSAYKSDFAMATNFIAASIVPIIKGKDQNVSNLKSNQKQGQRDQKQYKGGGRGRVNNSSRGRGSQYYQGRSAGHGRGRGRSQATLIGYIAPDDWDRMSRSQHDSVFEARGTKRKIDAVASVLPNVPTQVSAAVLAVSAITNDASTAAGMANQAGREFGRQAHQPNHHG